MNPSTALSGADSGGITPTTTPPELRVLFGEIPNHLTALSRWTTSGLQREAGQVV